MFLFLVMLGPVVRVIDVEGVRLTVLVVDDVKLDLVRQLHKLFDSDILTDRITKQQDTALAVTVIWE